MGGTSVLFIELLDEFCAFTDLTCVEAAIDKKTVRVEAEKATWGLRLRLNSLPICICFSRIIKPNKIQGQW